MFRFIEKLKEESAGAMVENVIVLPLVFVIIIFMIVSGFLIHDRTTIESAAKRGATFAAHCIADPNYVTLVGYSGELDYTKSVESMDFKSVGKNIKAYRYIGKGPDVESLVQTEVTKIVEKTRINWIPQDSIQVSCEEKNRLIYQEITVSVSATYSLPAWFNWFGLETKYEMTSEARLAAVDPDEFIRNADLVVDLITTVDNATGNHISKALDAISSLGTKMLDWIALD